MNFRHCIVGSARTIGVLLIVLAMCAGVLVETSAQRADIENESSGIREFSPPAEAASTAADDDKSKPTPTVPSDVIIGKPSVIPYSRAFPLLDGLFQDVSAIQLTQLAINVNQANASNIDAVIQQFQAALQYSQTLGLQNAAAAQQNAAYSASGALQSQLLNQTSQLINLQLAAQQQVAQAQAYLNTLPANATTEQKAAVQQSVQLATDNLNTITAQITNVKGLLSTAPPTAPTFSAAAPSPVGFPTPAVAITIPTAGGTPPFSPSFPASKQMENQINLLWERLANLVNTLAQSDNPNGISLVRFHTGIISGKKDNRKKRLLSTQYSLKCKADGKVPLVLDLFPRNAAVNISNMKYRDSRFSLAGFLSLFSVGANAAYNREHLQITQALGQSAYITGFGIETKSFGWVFSPSLGEEIVAPGDRTTFALIAAPADCKDVEIHLVNATWDKAPVALSEDAGSKKLITSWAPEPTPTPLCKDCVKRLAYAPLEFDPNNAGTTGAVTVNLKLDVPLDREQTITANGILLKRARDTYGRATAAGGSGGLLQATNIDAGTWIPINSKELMLHLNPMLFTRAFPSILLTSPNGSIDINQYLGKAEVEVAGAKYKCPGDANSNCAATMPPIGRRKATSKNFAVARWFTAKKFIITLQEPATSTVNSAASSTVIPALQVITGSRNQSWSGSAKVVAHQADDSYVPLNCEPLGERLLCDWGELNAKKRTDFEIYDGEFAAGPGPIKGYGLINACLEEKCLDPLIWEMQSPEWRKEEDAWLFRLSLVNVGKDQIVRLSQNPVFATKIHCDSDQFPCPVTIKLPLTHFSQIRNSMELQVYKAGGLEPLGGATTIANLRLHVAPILSYITEDQTRFSGQNLVFEKILVGSRGPLKISCAEARDCFVPSPGFEPKDEGYLQFWANGEPLAFMLITDKGLQVVAPHKPKPPETRAGATPPPTPVQQIQNQTFQLQINPDTRLKSFKQE